MGDDMVRVKTLYSGISRGTERLVFSGQVPASEHQTMRAPFQEGEFTFPLKYGYAAVGTVAEGARAGQSVFALYPHQTEFAVPSNLALTVPPGVPVERAVLGANMETALNILWDAHVNPGDRILVIGAGIVGILTAYLCAKIPGTEVCLVDIDLGKANLAETLGCTFAEPEAVPQNADVVIHTSATSAGLKTAITAASIESEVVEASWYGRQVTTLPLGGAFHQKRLRIISSQVGRIPAHMAARWTNVRRLAKALSLLGDPVLDVLVSGETAFETLPTDYIRILSDSGTLCHRIRYSQR